MPQRDMEPRRVHRHDVFISYAGFDRDVAAAMARVLESADVGIWWDEKLSPDEPFEQQIQRVLAETKVIIGVLSPQALTSEWVRWELTQASQNGLYIVLLLVHGVRPEELPPPLHLLPSLTLPDTDTSAFMEDVALRVRNIVGRIQRRPSGKDQNDARRRLASATARTARQAADIKYRKRTGGQRPSVLVSSTAQSSAEEEPVARYTMSDGLVSFLHDQNIAIAFTSSETGHLFLVGCTATHELTVDARRFRKATGLHLAGATLLMATLAHLYRMENILRPDQRLDGTFSHCYVPRTGHFTGVLDAHDVGMTNAGEAVFIATRYNCLAATSPTHSFKPLWKPPFISDIVAEDRCHLNGLAMRNGKPSYATAIGRSNEYDGWRDCVVDGGIVMDLERTAVICEGLSMPHSPRVHEDKLWLLNSGAGELGYIDLGETAPVRFRPVSFCPGFVRGLALRGRYAFVGLSRPRYGDFDGLELDTRLREAGGEAQCGLQIIDTASGQCIHWLRIDGRLRELYDIAVLPEVRCPTSVGFHNDEALDMISIEDPAQP